MDRLFHLAFLDCNNVNQFQTQKQKQEIILNIFSALNKQLTKHGLSLCALMFKILFILSMILMQLLRFRNITLL